MMRTTTLAAAFILAVAPVALAQPAPPFPNAPEAGERGPEREPGRHRSESGEKRGPGVGGHARGERHADDERDERRGREGRRGPPPRPHEEAASFHLDLGPTGSLSVRCGEQPLSQCVTAAQPLIDTVSGGAMGGAAAAPGIVPLPPVVPEDDTTLDGPPPPEADPSEVPTLPQSLSGDDGIVEDRVAPIETLEDGLPDGPNEETPVIDGLEGGAEPGPAN